MESPNDIKVKFTPWEDNGFKIELLHIWEKLGGEEPSGMMELSHDGRQEALDFITSQQTGVIEVRDDKNGGLSFSFGIFVVDRNFFNNRIELIFTIIPQDDLQKGKDFYTRPRSMTFNSLQEAVESVWPGKKINPIIKNVETDTKPDKKVYQDNETGYNFLKRLCASWKFKSVFAFSWEGLVIKKIDDLQSDIEITSGPGLWQQTNMTRLKYNSQNNNELFSPWTNDYKDDDQSISKSTTGEVDFKDKAPKFVTSSISKDTYKIHAPGYEVPEKNLKKNSEFHGYSSITIYAQDMPKDWKIGDIVKYKKVDQNNAENTEKDVSEIMCVVAGNEFFFAQNGATKTGPHGQDLEWTATLWGLDELDINKELQNNTQNNNE